MNDRKQLIFKEEDGEVFLVIKTLAPTKWLLLDRETGQMYQGNPGGYWDRLDPVIGVDKK